MIREALAEELDILCDRLGEINPWKRLEISGEALALATKSDAKRQVLLWDDGGTVLGVVIFRTRHYAEVIYERGGGIPLAERHNVSWPCSWEDLPDGGYVHALAVFSTGHGRGVGSQLLRAAENATLCSGVRRMYLMVSEFNRAAQGFYAMQGYRKIASMEDCLKAGNTEHLMEKRLREASATW